MKLARILLATIASMAVAPCISASDLSPPVVAAEPQLGAAFNVADSTRHEMISAGQISPASQVRYAGVVFTVAVNRAGRIIYVGTSDPAFKTPEGFTIATPLSQMLAHGIPQPVRESGWAYHTLLPSGWRAAFTRGAGTTESPLRPDSQARWFFKRS